MGDMNQRGPVEQALIGIPVPDVKNPVNVGRLVRLRPDKLGCAVTCCTLKQAKNVITLG